MNCQPSTHMHSFLSKRTLPYKTKFFYYWWQNVIERANGREKFSMALNFEKLSSHPSVREHGKLAKGVECVNKIWNGCHSYGKSMRQLSIRRAPVEVQRVKNHKFHKISKLFLNSRERMLVVSFFFILIASLVCDNPLKFPGLRAIFCQK